MSERQITLVETAAHIRDATKQLAAMTEGRRGLEILMYLLRMAESEAVRVMENGEVYFVD
ncbi:MAG: hypothetical protein WBD53_22270 [Xanthobacteraceae bacterium]